MDDSRVTAWHPRVPGVTEVLHARFTDHAYPMHSHDGWTLLIVDSGTVRYELGRTARATTRTSVTLLPPDVSHDGRAATAAGFRKRVVYLDRDLIGAGLLGRAVDSPTIPDIELHRRVTRMHEALATRTDDLEAESRLAFVTERLRAHVSGSGSAPEGERGRGWRWPCASCSMRASWRGSVSRRRPVCCTAIPRIWSARSAPGSVYRRTCT